MDDLKQSMPQPPGYSDLLVIDGDAIPYMIGWFQKDHADVERTNEAVDSFMNDFLTITCASRFIGILAFGGWPNITLEKCFRYEVYKYKSYKGSRPEKDEWIKFWEPHIRQRLIERWGFVCAPAWLETDDVVAYLSAAETGIICSPDKDLKQMPGAFYNYKELGTEKHRGVEIITEKEALRNFYFQLICGDSTDNVHGVNGMGEVKANKLLNETSEMLWKNEVKLAYQKQYGPHYGEIIYEETFNVIKMMTPEHPLWEYYTRVYGFEIEDYIKAIKNSNEYVRSFHREVE